MEFSIETRNDYVFTLSEQELLELLHEPKQAIVKMRKRAKEVLKESELPVSTTRARPRISSKVECPKCHLLFERQGLGPHMYARHNRKKLKAPKHTVKLIPAHTG